MGLRSVFCKIFECEAFKDHQAKIFGDPANPEAPSILGDLNWLKGQFPVTAEIPQDIKDQISSMELKIDELIYGAEIYPETVWLKETSRTASEISLGLFIKSSEVLEISAWGVGNGGAGLAGITFPASKLAFVAADRGGLTTDWMAVAGSAINPGELVIGGVKGEGMPIEGAKCGTIAWIRFEILEAGPATLIIQNLVDDIGGFTAKVLTLEL